MPYRTELKRPDLKGQFPCSVCGKVFCHSSSLSRHRMQAHFKSYTCTQCNHEISSNETLRSHMFKMHQISRMFMCKCCNWAFPDKTSLHIHMQSMSRNGKPGDVSVLARSLIEGESVHDFLGIDGHSPSSSPHYGDDEVFNCASVSPNIPSPSNNITTKSTVNNTPIPADFLINLSAAFSSVSNSNVNSSAQNLLTNKFNNTTATALLVNSQNQQQQNTIFPSTLLQSAEILKKIKTKTNNNTNNNAESLLLALNNAANGLKANNENQNNIQQYPSTAQNHPWLLNWLKNNPFLANNLDNGNKTNQDAKSIFAAAIAAIRSQINSATTLPSTFQMINSNSLLTESKNSTPINNSLISDISRLLCVAQQQQYPLPKKPRLSSDNKTLETNTETLSINTKNESRGLDGLSDSMNLRISINPLQTTLPLSQLSAVSVDSSANGAMSSTMSSPRSGTPTSSKINSLLYKISQNGSKMNESDLLFANGNAFDYMKSMSRRNKRKARFPQQLTPQATDDDDDIKTEEKIEKVLPSAKSATLENLVKFTQCQSKTLVQNTNRLDSEQHSPAFSDSQTSGSSGHLIDVGNPHGINNQKNCSNCKNNCKYFENQINKLEEELRIMSKSSTFNNKLCDEETMTENSIISTAKVNRFEIQMKHLKERLLSIAENATKTILEFEDSCDDVTETSRIDLLLNCLKGIEEIANTSRGLDDIDEDHENFNVEMKLSSNSLICNQSNGIVHNGVGQEIESEIEDEEEDGTIEIHCGLSPEPIINHDEKLSNNNDISENVKIENSAFSLKLELDV